MQGNTMRSPKGLLILSIILFSIISSLAQENSLPDLSLLLIGKSPREKAFFQEPTDSIGSPAPMRRLEYCGYAIKKGICKQIPNLKNKWGFPENQTTCFYPFSGPDIINAYLLFPDAKEYILIGLERAGAIPDLKNIKPEEFQNGIAALADGLQTFSKYNFYVTKDLESDIYKSKFHGLIPHLLMQMGILDLKPVSAHTVEFDKQGYLQFSSLEPGETTRSVMFDVVNSMGIKKRIIYLQLDLSDPALARNEKAVAWLQKQSHLSVVLKAASYLLHLKDFNMIRSHILSNAEVIVQDDSGIPYHMLKEKFQVALFGNYTGPNHVFPERNQPDLVKAFNTIPKKDLGFSFGYNHNDGSKNLMLAIKKNGTNK